MMSKTDDSSKNNYLLDKGNLHNNTVGENVKGDEWSTNDETNNTINISETYDNNKRDSGLEHIEVNSSNNTNETYGSIVDNSSSYYRINNSHSISDTYDNNTQYSRKNTYTMKNVSLNKLFIDLSYSNVISISEKGKEGIVKTYKKDGRVINFDVRNYKPELDNPRYVNVSKEKRPFKYGIYYRYKYTAQYENNTLVSYCYYRKVGNYHIIMGFFDKEDEFVRDMWLRWNEYIESILYQ